MTREPLPNAREEEDDPEDADHRYGEAVAVLRERTRDAKRFRLVFDENAEYGFRRNALGLRSLALIIAGAVFCLSVIFFAASDVSLASRSERWATTAVLAVGLLLYWLRVANEDWVRRSAERYADRLFEAIESLRTST